MGMDLGSPFPWIVGVVIVGILILMASNSDKFDLWPNDLFGKNLDEGFVGFDNVFGHDSFKFFNYIFGKVPNYAINSLGEGAGDAGSGISAGIIIIGIWALIFLFFSDIFKLFLGMGGPVVPWIAAALLAVIAANLRLLSIVSVYLLTVFAAFGALAVLFAIGSVFVLFIAFHFGSAGLRSKLILRRAEDEGLKAVAGGKFAASAITVLEEIAKKAKKAKEDGMYG